MISAWWSCAVVWFLSLDAKIKPLGFQAMYSKEDAQKMLKNVRPANRLQLTHLNTRCQCSLKQSETEFWNLFHLIAYLRQKCKVTDISDLVTGHRSAMYITHFFFYLFLLCCQVTLFKKKLSDEFYILFCNMHLLICILVMIVAIIYKQIFAWGIVFFFVSD